MHPLICIIAAAAARAAVDPGPPAAPTVFDRDIELITVTTEIYTESDGAIAAPYTIRVQHVDFGAAPMEVLAWAHYTGFSVTLWVDGNWLVGPFPMHQLSSDPAWLTYGLLWDDSGPLDDVIIRIEPREGQAEVTAGIVVSVAPA